MSKETTRDLINEFIDVEIEKETGGLLDLPTSCDIDNKLSIVKGKIKKKTEGIDRFMVELNRKEHLIDAEIEAIKDEMNRLKFRRKAIESMKKYFNNELIPMIVDQLGDENGVYETDTARYKMFETWGPVVVHNEDMIPDEYKVVKQTEMINKIKAKEKLKLGEVIPGLGISKVKRVRRS
jgi:arginyl-tRNA synthetase